MAVSPPYVHHSAPDGGWGWVVVFGSFMISLIGDGFSYTTGLFYHRFLEVYGKSEAITSLFESILTGMIYFAGPFASGLSGAYGCRKVAIVGSIMAVIGMLGSIALDNIYGHCLTLGFITGTGLGLLYLPQVMIVTFWFDKRLSFATGIAVCGSGLGISLFSYVGDILLRTYDWKGSLYILSGIMFTCVAFSSLFRNVPDTEDNSSLKAALKETFNFVILKDIVFLYFTFSNFLNATVYYVPIIFLKDHIIRTGIGTDSDVIVLMVVFGLANALGRALFGYIADKEFLNRLILFALSVITFGVSMGLMATIDRDLTLMTVYIIIFGVAEGAFVCLSSVVMVDLFGVERISNAFGIFNLFNGLASFIGPPLIGKTVDESTGYTNGFYISSVLTIISGVLLLFLPLMNRRYKRL